MFVQYPVVLKSLDKDARIASTFMFFVSHLYLKISGGSVFCPKKLDNYQRQTFCIKNFCEIVFPQNIIFLLKYFVLKQNKATGGT